MKKAIFFLLFFATAAATQAQNIKYKDLYFLLDTKKYDEAEPFLRRFLADPKNSDHANAHFQMAVLYQYKASKAPVLQQTELRTGYQDSALLHYNKAIQLIDEKEIKKNDEYYNAYNRRDVRTGKFGIKLADIQFDLEKKIEALNDQKAKTIELKKFYLEMISEYQQVQAKYNNLVQRFPSIKTLLLRANPETLQDLEDIKATYRRVVVHYKSYEKMSEKVMDMDIHQSLVQDNIVEYAVDGLNQADFLKDIIKLWDYSKWSEETIGIINNEIYPAREELVEFDRSLEELSKRHSAGLAVSDELGEPFPQTILHKLERYDAEPMPVFIANIRRHRLKYASIDDADSTNVISQLLVVKERLNTLQQLDTTLLKIESKTLDEEALNYRYFVESRFQSADNLKFFISEHRNFVDERLALVKLQTEILRERSRWLIFKTDSIPLFMPDQPTGVYNPLIVSENYTFGLKTMQGEERAWYYVSIDSTLAPSKIITSSMDKDDTECKNYGPLSAVSLDDSSGDAKYILVWCVAEDADQSKALVSKVAEDKMLWIEPVYLPKQPQSISAGETPGILRVNFNEGSEDISVE